MIKNIVTTAIFRRNLKKLKKKHYPIDEFEKVIDLLVQNDLDTLKRHYSYHTLAGNFAGITDIHIQKNWLLLCSIDQNDPDTLILIDTGDHSILSNSRFD